MEPESPNREDLTSTSEQSTTCSSDVRTWRPNETEDSSDSEEDSESSSEEEEEDKNKGNEASRVVPNPKPLVQNNRNKKGRVPTFEDELGLNTLPPVDMSRLQITAEGIKEEDCVPLGRITQIIDRLVLIESLPNIPAHNLDSLLFLDKGKKILGEIHDVMGNVKQPCYVVRFNSKEDVVKMGIRKELLVYSAPKTKTCELVVLNQLMEDKGTDKDPDDCFSDDEEDYEDNKKTPEVGKKRRASINMHKVFEAKMNFKNKLDTARHKAHVVQREPTRASMNVARHQTSYYTPPQMAQVPQPLRQPSFTPFAPRPNFTNPPPFNFASIPPPIMNLPPFLPPFQPGLPPLPFPPPSAQFCPPNQPFVPQAFCPPNIPPLPPAMTSQSPQQLRFTQPMQFPPPNLQMQQPPPPGIGASFNVPKPPHPQQYQQTASYQQKQFKQTNQSAIGVVPKTQTVSLSEKSNNNNKAQMSQFNQPPPPLPRYEFRQSYLSPVALPNTSIPPPQYNQNMPIPNMVPPAMPHLMPHMGPPIPAWTYQHLPTQTPPHVGGNF